jgi:NRAMP (natural resistance-associated macrophage protein)-like metal ion transporter
MAGLADNDPAGLATYAIAGAVAGYSQLWLLVVATIMVQAVQVTSAKLGNVTQQGLLRLTRVRYGWTLAACIGLIAVVANQASLIADTAGIGASLQLLTGLSWQWFVVPSSLILMTITIFFRFREIFIAYLAAGTLMLAYLVTAFLTHPNWGAVLHGTIVPHLPTGVSELSAAVALMGTTISPYLLIWQAEGEREVHRTRRQFRLATIDVTVGYVFSNLISYFVIVTTAATLFVHHKSIQTAADAATALRPLAGDLASVVFAVGLLGAGLLAVPMFAISSSYAVAELFDWPLGLSKSLREAPAFYAVLGLAFLSGCAAILFGLDPIITLFYSQVLDGFLMPILVVVLFLLANDRRVMGQFENGPYYNLWLVITFLVMMGGAILLVISLV